MRRLMRKRLLVSLVVGLLVLSACAGGEDEPDAAEDDVAEGGDDGEGDTEEESQEAPDEEESAQGSDVDFSGETLLILIPFSPGGTADVTARLTSEFLGDFLPGNPTVTVENLTGGGGSLAVNDLIANQPDDGSVMVSVTGGVILRHLLGVEGHDYPLGDMPVVGALPGGLVTVVSTDVGETAEDALAAGELNMGVTSPGGHGAFAESLGADLFGLDVNQIFGYDGFGEIVTAIERGEVQGATPGDLAYVQTYQPLEADGVLNPIFQTGVIDDGEVVRSPLVPDVPTLVEVYEDANGEEPSGELYDAYELMPALATVSTAIVTHPDAPNDRVEALQAGFADMVESDAWRTRTEESLGLPAAGIDGSSASQALLTFLSADEGIVARLQDEAAQE